MNNDKNTKRKLVDQLIPSPGAGSLIGVLGTTYTFDVDFFECDFLPSLLMLRAWNNRGWSSRIALEKSLALTNGVVIFQDALCYRGRPRSLRVETNPVWLPSGNKLHAKVLLIVYEDFVKLIIGSANITEAGFRKNREIAAVLDADSENTENIQLIYSALNEMPGILNAWWTDTAAKVVEDAKRKLTQWKSNKPNQIDRFVWSTQRKPLWKQFIQAWPQDEIISTVRIVSPFWSEETKTGPFNTFINELSKRNLINSGTELHLYTESRPQSANRVIPVISKSFNQFSTLCPGITCHIHMVDRTADTNNALLPTDSSPERDLHAKIAVFENNDTSLAYAGSANFTNKGWGFIPSSNIEAGIILLRRKHSTKDIKSLIPDTTGNTIELNGNELLDSAEPDAQETKRPWPIFINSLILKQRKDNSGILYLEANLNVEYEPEWWKISIPNDNNTQLLDNKSIKLNDNCINRELDETDLSHILREQQLSVAWAVCPEGILFPVNVELDARTSLPVSPVSGSPTEKLLIEYYQGRIAWEDLFPEDPAPSQTETSIDNLPGSAVDTSTIPSYIIREFIEAIPGIETELQQCTVSEPSMRLAVLGPVSPLTLAKEIVKAARSDKDKRSYTAAGFQLLELLLCINKAKSYMLKKELKASWLQLLNKAEKEIETLLSSLYIPASDAYSKQFIQYKNKVKRQIR